MPEPTPPTRRRWFRFGLRTLLVFTALVGLLMGWIVKERRQSAREMEIASQLESQGWQVDCAGAFDSPYGRTKQAWWRRLAAEVLGARVNSLSAKDSPDPVDDITPLIELKSLTYLNITRTQVSDLAPLAELEELFAVSAGSTQVKELAPLYGLTKLQILNIRNTQITQRQINALRQALPNCRIYR